MALQKVGPGATEGASSCDPVQWTSPAAVMSAGAVATEGASSSELALWVGPETRKQSRETAVCVQEARDQAPCSAGVRAAQESRTLITRPEDVSCREQEQIQLSLFLKWM